MTREEKATELHGDCAVMSSVTSVSGNRSNALPRVLKFGVSRATNDKMLQGTRYRADVLSAQQRRTVPLAEIRIGRRIGVTPENQLELSEDTMLVEDHAYQSLIKIAPVVGGLVSPVLLGARE
jgi:hypothetical protein